MGILDWLKRHDEEEETSEKWYALSPEETENFFEMYKQSEAYQTYRAIKGRASQQAEEDD